MRTGILCSALTAAAIAFGACGGKEPTRLVHCDRDLSCVDQAIIDGLGYTRNCSGESPTVIYGKEVKVCGDGRCRSDNGTVPASCIAFGAAGNDLMFVGFDSVAWPLGAWSSVYGGIGGQTLNSKRPLSFALKSADYPVPPTTNSDVEFYLNTQFGGGCANASSPGVVGTYSACMRFGVNAIWTGSFSGSLPGSVEFNRWCGINPNGSGVPC